MAVRFRAIGICLLGALGLAWWLAGAASGIFTAQAQPAVARLEIIAIDTSRFPDTTVTFRVFDADDQAIRGLTEFQLLENEQEVDAAGPPVEAEQPAPVSLMVLLDQGYLPILRYRRYYDPATLKSIFEALGSHYLREGDTVCLAVGRYDADTAGRQQTLFPLECGPFSPAYSEATAGLDINLAGRFPARDPREVQGVRHIPLFQDALDALAGRSNPVIVFLSAYIAPLPGQAVDPGKNPSQMTAEQIAREAAAAGGRIFVLQAAGNTLAANPAELQTPMITLAQNSGGQYVELNVAQDYVAEARAAFDAIRPIDHTYTLTYRSVRGDAGERQIAVFPAGRPELAAEGAVVLELQPLVAGEATPRDSQWELSVPITWPDGLARDIRSIRCSGQLLDAADYTYLDGVLQLTLDESMTGDLRCVVEDELGLTAEFTATIAAPAPPTATPAPATPTPIPAPAATAEPANPLAGALPWIVLGGVAVAAGGLYVAARRGALARTSQKSDQGAPRVKTIPTARDQKQALAYLLVLTGREDLINQNIPLYNEITTIGRDPQLTDIQLYHPHELSSISGQHCTIQVDHGQFLIIDNNSANGTFVNGATLIPDMPHQLHDADEIVLGDKAQRGAQLRFEVSQKAINRHLGTVIDADWQDGDRSGTETVTGPPRAVESAPGTDPRLPLDELRPPGSASDTPPDSMLADDGAQPPTTGSGG